MFNRKKILEAMFTIEMHKREAMTGNFGAEILILRALTVIKDNYGLRGVHKLSAELGMTSLVNNWIEVAKNYERKIGKGRGKE
jgi:hypothetical protein